MNAPRRNPAPAPIVAWRSLAWPAEHGGWGFVLEPVALGLIVSPSLAALALAVFTLFAFLARHPLRLAIGDRLKGRAAPRTCWAERFGILYGSLSLLGLAAASAHATGPDFWLPLLAAAPLLVVQFARDARNRGRELMPELLGATAPGALASSIAIAGGWAREAALALWLLLALRGAASVLYVRARLRLDRGLPHGSGAARASHLLALVIAAVLAAAGRVPWLAVVAFAALLARAGLGLSAARRPLRPQGLGLRELAYGLGTAAAIGLGYVRSL